MTKAFCPGHLTCFFQPVMSYDPMSAGSKGAGIRLSKGSLVTVEERMDQRIEIIMDGEHTDADITRLTLRMLSPERGFDVEIENQLPMSQGFAMSAAGAVAAGLCACHIAGMKRSDAFKAAHIAEIQGGGGLGDVSALMTETDLPIRTVAGLPPLGKVLDGGSGLSLTLAVLGPPLNTTGILSDKTAMDAIASAGYRAADSYAASSSLDDLFRISRAFSKAAGLETPRISECLGLMGKEKAAMCMLGNSIFTTASKERTSDLLGHDVPVIGCNSTSEEARIIHKG